MRSFYIERHMVHETTGEKFLSRGSRTDFVDSDHVPFDGPGQFDPEPGWRLERTVVYEEFEIGERETCPCCGTLKPAPTRRELVDGRFPPRRSDERSHLD